MHWFVVVVSLLHQTPSTWEWVDRQGVTHFTDDRSTIPAGAKAKQTTGGELTIVPSSTRPTPAARATQNEALSQPLKQPSSTVPPTVYLAIAMAVFCHLWLTWLAFDKGVGWGIAVFAVPLAALVFMVTDWRVAKWPFMMNVLALLVLVVTAITRS